MDTCNAGLGICRQWLRCTVFQEISNPLRATRALLAHTRKEYIDSMGPYMVEAWMRWEETRGGLESL